MNATELYEFLEREGLTYRGTLMDLAKRIEAFVRDGEGDSLPRALALTRSLERLLSIGE